MKPAELKTIRESLGLTIRDIAAIGNVSPRTVQNWENGRHDDELKRWRWAASLDG